MVHHIKEDDVILIEQTFAFLTPHGWIVPTWVQMLRDKDSPPCTVDIKQSMVYGQFPYIHFGVNDDPLLDDLSRTVCARRLHQQLHSE
jgi:hypothetical protein